MDPDQNIIPIHGIAAPIGVVSGDGRMFAPNAAVTWRALPLPISYQDATDDGHNGAVRVGIISEMSINRDNMVVFSGFLNMNYPLANRVVEGLVFGDVRSVSVDLGAAEATYSDDMSVLTFSTVEIAGLTAVGVGAFKEAFLALGSFPATVGDPDADGDLDTDGPEKTQPAPEANPNPDAPPLLHGGFSEGEVVEEIEMSAALERLFELLADMGVEPVTASAAVMERVSAELVEEFGVHDTPAEAPSVILASATPAERPPLEWFLDPQMDHKTNLTITPEGRVYGHLATWDACHVGMQGVCSTPNHTQTDYAYAHSGVLETDGGDILVGPLTMGIGHASVNASPAAAMAHYDKPDAVVADVNFGEDGIGIWYSGALRQIDDDRRRELRATARVSGDWRPVPVTVGGRQRLALELISATVVNTFGYPIPSQMGMMNGHQTALIASANFDETPTEFGSMLEVDHVVGLVEEVIDRVEKRAIDRDTVARSKPIMEYLDVELESHRSEQLEAATAILEEV